MSIFDLWKTLVSTTTLRHEFNAISFSQFTLELLGGLPNEYSARLLDVVSGILPRFSKDVQSINTRSTYESSSLTKYLQSMQRLCLDGLFGKKGRHEQAEHPRPFTRYDSSCQVFDTALKETRTLELDWPSPQTPWQKTLTGLGSDRNIEVYQELD